MTGDAIELKEELPISRPQRLSFDNAWQGGHNRMEFAMMQGIGASHLGMEIGVFVNASTRSQRRDVHWRCCGCGRRLPKAR